jgi:DNA-binding CsgD family transcriptional regulator
MIEKFVFERKYEDSAWLKEQYIDLGRSSKDIAKELHVSYKLVEIHLANFDIPIRQNLF